MTDREFVIAFVLARAGAINGTIDIYGIMYDAEHLLTKINGKFQVSEPLANASRSDPYERPSMYVKSINDDEISF